MTSGSCINAAKVAEITHVISALQTNIMAFSRVNVRLQMLVFGTSLLRKPHRISRPLLKKYLKITLGGKCQL